MISSYNRPLIQFPQMFQQLIPEVIEVPPLQGEDYRRIVGTDPNFATSKKSPTDENAKENLSALSEENAEEVSISNFAYGYLTSSCNSHISPCNLHLLGCTLRRSSFST